MEGVGGRGFFRARGYVPAGTFLYKWVFAMGRLASYSGKKYQLYPLRSHAEKNP